ncbi:MAG: hypothetical protein ACKOPE_02565 [Novosphingobium sp.]
MKSRYLALLLATLMPSLAHAHQGVGDPVYGATLEDGTTEFEARYGRLTGGSEDGADGLVFEVEHSFSNRFAAATLIETARDPGGQRIVQSASIEAIHTLGHVDALALDVAVYGEYKFGIRGQDDVAEGKILLEHRAGSFDARVNLIAEKPLRASDPVELGYAASADWAVLGDDLRFGVAGFGDLGTTSHFGGRQETFAGPEVKTEFEIGGGELEIEAGWLKSFGAARDVTSGQARLLVGFERKF